MDMFINLHKSARKMGFRGTRGGGRVSITAQDSKQDIFETRRGGGNGYIVVNRRVYWDVLVPG